MAQLLPLALGAHMAAGRAAPPDCGALRSDYRAAVTAAQQCDPASPHACAALRVAALEDACHCEIGVNPARTADLDRLLAAYRAQACPSAPALCNRRCMTPATRCLAAPGSTGRCEGR